MSVRAKSRPNPGVLFLTVVAALVAWPGPAVHLQTPPPTATQKPQVFRAGADVVPVYATVRDPDRGFVLDLTQDDFELYDEGRLQKITQFTIAAQPLSTVVLIDGSVSMMAEFNRAIEGARNFVLRMLPEDRGRIGSFADRVVIGPRFTSDRDALLKYLDDQFNLRVGGETHLWEGLLESVMTLGEESGKRVVIVMSDGYNFVVPPECRPPQSGGGSSGGYPPVGGRGPATPPIGVGGRNPAGGVALPGPPPVGRPGSTGPVNGAPPSMTLGCFADPTTYGVTTGQVDAAASARNVIVYGLSMWTRQGITTERPSRHLERVSLDTGGAFYEVGLNDDMNRIFTEVVQQLRQQYVLGFVPAAFDGRRHSLSVRVKRQGLQVQARRFYVAERTR
jgi:hypothetical protein